MPAEHVLLVDDHAINLKLARIILELEGFRVTTALDAENALEQLLVAIPDVIVTDIQLPGLDGLELTRRVKAAASTKDVIVIALTAYAMKGDEEKALAAGCDDYVVKPMTGQSLPEAIARQLTKRGGST